MADHEEQEFTTSKRARWSSQSSCDQNTSFVDTIDQRESNEGSLLRLIESEQNYLVESQPSEIELREQHGVHVSSDRLESDDFPTCFSVEDDLDDIDEHHFQPIAGNKKFYALKSLLMLVFTTIACPPFCFKLFQGEQ